MSNWFRIYDDVCRFMAKDVSHSEVAVVQFICDIQQSIKIHYQYFRLKCENNSYARFVWASPKLSTVCRKIRGVCSYHCISCAMCKILWIKCSVTKINILDFCWELIVCLKMVVDNRIIEQCYNLIIWACMCTLSTLGMLIGMLYVYFILKVNQFEDIWDTIHDDRDKSEKRNKIKAIIN